MTQSYIERLNNKSFYRMLLLLSGDINLNPESKINLQPLDSNDWNAFKSKGLHIIHLNINILLPKIDDLRYIANSSNAAVIGISESKLDESILQSEIQINSYDLLRQDKNRIDGGVTCYISYIQKQYCPKEIENIFFQVILPKTKPPIVVGIIYIYTIIYLSPSQNNLLEIQTKHFLLLIHIRKKHTFLRWRKADVLQQRTHFM